MDSRCRGSAQTASARSVGVTVRLVRNPDKRRRELVFPLPGEPSYVPGAWDEHDLQAVVDELAVEDGNADRRRRQDLLVKLGVHGRGLRFPKQGLRFIC
jgi:hypothetical protein